MHSTNLALAFNSHYSTSNLCSAIFMHFTDLPLTLNRAFDLFIAQTLLSLLAFIDVHPSSNLVFYALHRLFSHPQKSFLQVKALFCSFYAFHRPCSYSFESLVRTFAQVFFFYSDLFMHSIDHALTLKWHLCAS